MTNIQHDKPTDLLIDLINAVIAAPFASEEADRRAIEAMNWLRDAGLVEREPKCAVPRITLTRQARQARGPQQIAP